MDVVILCGGKGTRSYPFTEYFPKVMMPICGTPILVHLMRIYAQQGFTSFVLAAGHRQEMLHDYFDGRFGNWKVRILNTGEESDTGERLLRCAEHVGQTFFATYGDGLGNVDLQQLLAFHRRSEALATLTVVPLRSQYGAVRFGGDNVVRYFEEKPVIGDHWINAGFFVFDKKIFEHWTQKNLESQALPDLARRGSLYAYQHHGFWKSMDTAKDQQELERIYQERKETWADPEILIPEEPIAEAVEVK
jgi:glucose-1-phosphate cytidylyltransferase